MPGEGGQGGPPFGARAGATADAQRLETSHFGSSWPIFPTLTWGDAAFPEVQRRGAGEGNLQSRRGFGTGVWGEGRSQAGEDGGGGAVLPPL